MYWNCFSVLPSIVLPMISRFSHIGRGLSPDFAGLARGIILLSGLNEARELRPLPVVGRLFLGVLQVVDAENPRLVFGMIVR